MKFVQITVTVLSVAAVVVSPYFIVENIHHRQRIKDLQNQIDEHTILKEKEGRIKHMERTLMVHYKISWYEAHYYSIIFDDYVQKYDSLFKAHNIDWQIFPAIIRIESNFNPTAVSKKMAKGIMQLLDETAEEMIEKINTEDQGKGRHPIKYTKKVLFNDVLNMIFGIEYLCKMIAETQDFEAGIQAYLGGPGFDKGRKDIGRYRTTVRWEYDRLKYIHKGVINDTLPIEAPIFILQEIEQESEDE